MGYSTMILLHGRSMQGKKHWYFFLCFVAVATFVFVHLENEIARLDEARQALESRLTVIHNNGFPRTHQRSPAQYDGQLTGQQYRTAINQDVIIYNRVPKTGSTSFAGLAYDICRRNKFSVLHLNATTHVLSIADQARFIHNITRWTTMRPALYHGHLAYLEFGRFGVSQRPIYINILRNPIDRLVSYYYFLRNGDDFRPYLKRSRAGDKETFDECVANDGFDCSPQGLWLQIPFFCGHHNDCWMPGNKWALQQAKHNLVNNFLVVGVTEELDDFISVLEAVLPRFFKGAKQYFKSGNKSHLRKTYRKIQPSQGSLAKLRESDIWQMEHEFYEFAREHFHFIKKRTFNYRNGNLVEKGQLFKYEKIRPRTR